jgi:hypothetical protein
VVDDAKSVGSEATRIPSRLQFPIKMSKRDRRIGLYWAAALVED